MQFELTERQKLVRRSIRNFSEEVLQPVAAKLDKEAVFSWDVAKELSKINAWGIQLPEKYGGAELDTISYSIIIEELSRVCASTGVGVTVHNSVCAFPIYKFGNEYQREKYLPDLASGNKIGGFMWTEPNAGSDAGGIECMAVEDGDELILNGSKIFVTNGGCGSIFLVGTNYKMKDGRKGVAALIVEKDWEGYEIGPQENKLGIRGNPTASIYFNDVRVPKENILGDLRTGFKIAMQTLDCGRIGIAAQALGIAQAAFDHALKYSKGREQFRRPIAKFQGVSFKIAEMITKIKAARLMVYHAAFMKDIGDKYSKEAAMCKLYASEVAREVTQEAIQIHGGYGLMKDLPVERYYRDAKFTEIYEGTSEIMKLVISNHYLRRGP